MNKLILSALVALFEHDNGIGWKPLQLSTAHQSRGPELRGKKSWRKRGKWRPCLHRGRGPG